MAGQSHTIPLRDGWTAATSTDALRRSFADPSEVDAPAAQDWHPIDVPGHWQRCEAFEDREGPLLYRHRFDSPGPATGLESDVFAGRWWLNLEGVFYTSDIWLDGDLLGDTEGYFAPHDFEVTEQLTRASEHLLGAEVSCSPVSDPRRKRNLTGAYQHSDSLDDTRNPGGLWGAVTLSRTGPVRIERHRVLCSEANPSSASLVIKLTLDSLLPRQVVLRATVAGHEHTLVAPLAAGETTHELTLNITNPVLWWPRSLGDPVLHDLTVEVLLPEDDPEYGAVAAEGGTSDRLRLRTGFRAVQRDGWCWSVNGERLFLKGANQPPLRRFPAEETPEVVRRMVAAARSANLDLLRFCGHVPTDAVLDACDEAGLLAWVDMPLQWGYHRSVRPQALVQARRLVDLHGHRPSIVTWCAHNEPFAVRGHPPLRLGPVKRGWRFLRGVGAQQLPSWDRSILDPAVQRVLRSSDPTRPVEAHSGVLPHLPLLSGSDSHIAAGWRFGTVGDLRRIAAAVPRVVRFVSAFGAQSVPEDSAFCGPERFPDLDWQDLRDHHGIDLPAFERHVPPERFADFEGWKRASQAYQADLLCRQVADLRRIKYRPAGGFSVHFLADGDEMVSNSLVGVDGTPKPALRALGEACSPVLVVADRLGAALRPGERVTLEVHLVSDLRDPVKGVVLAEIEVAGLRVRRGWTGAVGPDEVVRVGTLELEVPGTGERDRTPSQEGARLAEDGTHVLWLRLTFEGGGHRSEWFETARIIRPGGG